MLAWKVFTSDSASNSITVVGSINADIWIHVDRMPMMGETIDSLDENSGYVKAGGKGANQAAAISFLNTDNGKTNFISSFGNCGNSKSIHKYMSNSAEFPKLDISSSTFNPDFPIGQAFIMFNPKLGENSIILVGGANRHFLPFSSSQKSIISSSKVVLLQQEIPHSVNQEVAEIAHSHNVPVWLDMGGQDNHLSPTFLSHLSLIAPNFTEFIRLTHQFLPDKIDYLNSLKPTLHRELISLSRELQTNFQFPDVLITLGTDGSVYIPKSTSTSVTLTRVVPFASLVDSTGAGDCFRASLAAAFFDHNLSFDDSLLFARTHV
jgi:ribokinase